MTSGGASSKPGIAKRTRAVAARKPKPLRRPMSAESDPIEDTALRSLTREDRAKLSMDAWEPSLLRHLLTAEGKLSRRRKR